MLAVVVALQVASRARESIHLCEQVGERKHNPFRMSILRGDVRMLIIMVLTRIGITELNVKEHWQNIIRNLNPKTVPSIASVKQRQAIIRRLTICDPKVKASRTMSIISENVINTAHCRQFKRRISQAACHNELIYFLGVGR